MEQSAVRPVVGSWVQHLVPSPTFANAPNQAIWPGSDVMWTVMFGNRTRGDH